MVFFNCQTVIFVYAIVTVTVSDLVANNCVYTVAVVTACDLLPSRLPFVSPLNFQAVILLL